MRWTVDFPQSNDTGEIVDCGLAMIHEAGASAPTTYWCNAQCQAPPEENQTCAEGYCSDEELICAEGRCTGGSDCEPERAP